jgi:anti-sigma regulatory factor (Ser/Thr protein kinase)
MILKLSLDLPEDHEYIRTTRLLSRTLLEDLHVVPDDIDDIETIVAELCANVVRHAHSRSARFHVVIEYHREKAVITVEDTGVGFRAEDAAAPGTERSDDLTGGARVGGFGVPLVQALSDRLQFKPTTPQGTTARAEKNLRYETAQAEDRAETMDQTGGAAIEVDDGALD